jgi:hypothetical protein
MTDATTTNYASVPGDGNVATVATGGTGGTTTVEVVAPSVLPSGYHLNVDVNGRHMVVLVVCNPPCVCAIDCTVEKRKQAVSLCLLSF